jgi:hypothetical protein
MSKLVDKERLAKLAKALDTRMKNTVAAEAEIARAAEQANAQAIANEVTRATGEEARIEGLVTAEAAKAREEEGKLAQAIADEASRADAAEKLNKKAIEDEVSRAQGKENEIAGNLAKEITDREAAVGVVQGNLDDFEGQYAQDKQAQSQKDAAQDKAIEDEIARATAAEQVNANAIAQEATDRAAAVKAVQDKLNEFIGEDASGKSVAEQMADMKADMEAADEALQGNIDAEAQTARAAELKLTQDLAKEVQDRKDAVSGEESARKAADEELQGAIDAIEADLVVIKGADTVEGSIAKAEKDAKDYADQKIAALVDSAPDAMNTLNELAEAISANKDVYDAYVEQHAQAMTQMKTDLQAEIDADVLVEQQRAEKKEAELDQAIKDEADRAGKAEEKIAGDLTKAVSDLQAEIDADVLVEENARKEADQALQNAIDSINNGTNGILKQAKDYADEKDAALKADLQKEIDDDVKVETDRAIAAETQLAKDFAAADAALKTELQAEIDADVKVEKERAEGIEAGLQAAIEAEATTARAAEKANKDAIAILNGDVNQVGSVDKKLADALADYTDTEGMKAILGNVVQSLALTMENDKVVLKLGGEEGIALTEVSLDLATDADIDAIIAGLDA